MTHDLPEALADYIRRSRIALAVSTMTGDVPLILVNRKFCDLTGYDPQDVEGRNCRLLQGPDTPDADRAELHAFVHDPERESGRFRVLNYRKDGSTFDNLVFMSRLRDAGGAPRFMLASQFDMTSAEQRRARPANDSRLTHELSEIQTMGRQFGLAMEGSAAAISQSVAMLAKLHLDE